MRTLLLLPLVLALPAYAGTSAKQVVAPTPDPCITTWFAGASVGYLTELETPMYNAHVGITNSYWNFAGWNTALYLEVGYANEDWNERQRDTDNGPANIDCTVVPITANVKFERNLTGNLNAYIGGGLGVAYIGVDVPGDSDSDWVFTAQLFAGLSYNVSQACEIYGGVRWIYLSDPSLYGADRDIDQLQDNWLIELGARFKF